VSLELVASVAGAAASVAAVVGAAYSLGRKIALIEARLSQLEGRVSGLERRLASVEGEMSALKGGVGELKASFESELTLAREELRREFGRELASLEERLKGELSSAREGLRSELGGEIKALEERLRSELASVKEGLRLEFRGELASLEERLRKELKGELSSLEERLKGYVDARVSRIARAFSGYQEFVLECLSMKGLLDEREVRFMRGEARRLAELAANPFTKEEWERLKQLLDKEPEELTLEEAYELRDLARKALEEYGDRYEAYALHAYAAVVVGLAYRRLSEKQQAAKGESGGQATGAAERVQD